MPRDPPRPALRRCVAPPMSPRWPACPAPYRVPLKPAREATAKKMSAGKRARIARGRARKAAARRAALHGREYDPLEQGEYIPLGDSDTEETP